MDNVKVKGIVDECGVKHFEITNTDTGEIHIAVRSGLFFEVGEFRGTLKQCKQIVSDSAVRHFADAPEEESDSSSTWDCVHPAALLAMVVSGGSAAAIADGENSEIDRCLDAFGYLRKDGSVDIDRAIREFNNGKVK